MPALTRKSKLPVIARLGGFVTRHLFAAVLTVVTACIAWTVTYFALIKMQRTMMLTRLQPLVNGSVPIRQRAY
jgi:hypothetical protein